MKGFVFGKYLPFHEGHLALIRFASQYCRQLTVVVCASDKEILQGSLRTGWITEAVADDDRISCIVCDYKESELPNSSVPSETASQLWARRFKTLLPDADLLFTSEDYGPLVARYMQIEHRYFDKERNHVRISSTQLRNDLYGHWHFLPLPVQQYFAIKVAVLGTESTGKTTLVQQLTTHYHCAAVMEAGRDVISDSNAFTYDDLVTTAIEHANAIENADVSQHPLLVLDTDIHITQSYCRMFLKRELDVDQRIMEINRCDLYLYLCNDVPFVQDGTRLSEEDRNALDISHHTTLRQASVPFTELSGSWNNKFTKARTLIDAMMVEKNKLRWRTDER